MKASTLPRTVAAFAVTGAALVCTTMATAQTVVVPSQSAPPAPPPAPAPVVVTQPAPASAPPSSNVIVNGGAPAALPAGDEVTRPYTRPNRALLMTGLVAFGVPYIASVSVAATSSHVGDSNLWVPALGPWLDMGARGGCSSNNVDCGAETGNKVALAADGVLQTFGVLEIIGAFVFPETYGATTVMTGKNGATLSLTPAKLGSGGYGLSAVGQF